MSDAGDLTRALNAGGPGGLPPDVEAELLAELRGLARAHMAREAPSHTLQVTALVHEAFLRLAHTPTDAERQYTSRGHFLSYASRTMRNVLVDHARQKKADKRGGDWTRITLAHPKTDAPPGSLDHAVELLDLSNALDDLMHVRPDLADVIDLRYFGGLTVEGIAAATGQSHRTVERRMRMALAWLLERLESDA